MKRVVAMLVVVGIAGLAGVLSSAGGQPGPQGKGPKGDPAFTADRETFHYLLDRRKDIRRQVTRVAAGVETLTESDDPKVTARIQEHVEAMHRRIKEGRPIHLRDPLFREIFRHADKVEMKIERTAKGAKVTESSRDPYVARLIQAHADVVSLFLKNGHWEVKKNHMVPER
jgi:hypothetical protein